MKLSTRFVLPLFFFASANAKFGGGGKRRRTRKLLTPNSIPLKQSDPSYHEIISRCGAYEYDVSLYVDSHLFGVAAPKEDALAAGCPFVVSHAVEDPTAVAGVSKEILIWHSKDKAHLDEEGFHPVGTLKLSDIARAIDQAEPTRTYGRLYNIWHTNCADYMVNLGYELGLKADAKVTSFVVRRLLENYGDEWVDKVRNEMKYFSEGRHLVEEDDMTNEEVVELLVETRTSELLD